MSKRPLTWNVSQLAEMIGKHRDTVTKRIRSAGVKPAEVEGRVRKYLLAHVLDAFAMETPPANQYLRDRLKVIWRLEINLYNKGALTLEDRSRALG